MLNVSVFRTFLRNDFETLHNLKNLLNFQELPISNHYKQLESLLTYIKNIFKYSLHKMGELN
jgi:hypothetical protein